LLQNPDAWECPVCADRCPCASCERRVVPAPRTKVTETPPQRSALKFSQTSEKRMRAGPEHIKKGWSDEDTAMLIFLVNQHCDHKNKWKLVAQGMPDARTPGQVKEKYHRLQKTPDFAALQARILAAPQLSSEVHSADLYGTYTASDGGPSTLQNQTQSLHSAGSDRARRAKRPAASDDEWDWSTNPPAKSPRLFPLSVTGSSGLRLMRSKKSASGFRGVSRAGSRWEAYIGNGTSGKRYIGRFDTSQEAAEAYAEAFMQLNGRCGAAADDEEDDDSEASPGLQNLKACLKCKRVHHTVAYCRREHNHEGPNWDEDEDCDEGPQNSEVIPPRDEAKEPKPLFCDDEEKAPRQPGVQLKVVKEESDMDLPEGVELIRSPHAASGFQGVSRAGSKWEAYISGGPGRAGKRYIGRFCTPQEAAAAYAIELKRLRSDSSVGTAA